MVKILKKTKTEIVFLTNISKVTGRYKGVYIPKGADKNFSPRQPVKVTIKKTGKPKKPVQRRVRKRKPVRKKKKSRFW